MKIKHAKKHNKLLEDGVCLTCGQDLDNSDLSFIDISELNDIIIRVTSKLEVDYEILEDTSEKLESVRSKYQANQKKYYSAKEKLAKEKESSFDKYEEISDKISDLQLEIASCEEEIEEKKENLDEYELIQKILQKGSAKNMIVDDYMPFINTQVNEYLKSLRLNILFELDSDFNETLRSRYRDKFSYDNFSSGEKNCIDYALLFTFIDLASKISSVKTNLLVIDEISSRFDESKTEFLEDLINPIEGKTVFALTPSTNFKGEGMFDGVKTLQKEKNFSSIH